MLGPLPSSSLLLVLYIPLSCWTRLKPYLFVTLSIKEGSTTSPSSSFTIVLPLIPSNDGSLGIGTYANSSSKSESVVSSLFASATGSSELVSDSASVSESISNSANVASWALA